MESRHAHNYTGPLLRWLPAIGMSLLLLVSLALVARPAAAASPHVDRMVLNSEINAASLQFLTQAIDTAEHDGATALVIEVDSPGGDITSMKAMTQKELASTVPIISYVSPTGAYAASAASFITLAAQVAAMAPTTRIGAASPVSVTGGDIGETLKAKIENDLVASMTGIQSRYGRNVPLATAMITQAKSYDDATAVRSQIVDLGAPSLNALLTMVNGRSVKLQSGVVTLHTAGISVQLINASATDSFYAFLLDPNVIFLLFIIAIIGIYLEISHPGVILPGVAGAISLLLFLFAVGSITPNWAGLALMVLAFALLVLDLKLPTHGVLTVGAVFSLITGALLFFNSGGPYDGEKINPVLVYVVSGFVGLIGLVLVTFIVRAQRARVTTGPEGMIGARAVALTPLYPEGRVRYGGENWKAILDIPNTSVDAGSVVQIVGVEGLRLRVRPVG